MSLLAEAGRLPLAEGGLDPLIDGDLAPAIPDLAETGLLVDSGWALAALERTDPVLDPPGFGLVTPERAEDGLDLPTVGLSAPDCPEGFLSLLADRGLSDPPDPLLLAAGDGDFFPAEVGREAVLEAADAGLEPKLSITLTKTSKPIEH